MSQTNTYVLDNHTMYDNHNETGIDIEKMSLCGKLGLFILSTMLLLSVLGLLFKHNTSSQIHELLIIPLFMIYLAFWIGFDIANKIMNLYRKCCSKSYKGIV